MIHITCTTPHQRMRGSFDDVRGAVAAVFHALEDHYGEAAPPSLSLQYWADPKACDMSPNVLDVEARQ